MNRTTNQLILGGLLIANIFTQSGYSKNYQESSLAYEKIEELIEKLKKSEKESTTQKLTRHLAPFVFGALCLELCFLTASEPLQQGLVEQFQPKNLVFNFAREYPKRLFTTFMHELGHAVTAKILCDNPIDIHLGTSIKNDNTPSAPNKTSYINADGRKVTTVKHSISIDGINPCTGYATTQITLDATLYALSRLPDYCEKHNLTLYELNDKELTSAISAIMSSQDFLETIEQIPANKRKKALILLAGGASGALSNVMIKLMFSDSNKNLSEKLTYAFTPDSITIHNLFNMLLPYGSNGESDASKLYIECLGLPKKSINAIGALTPGLEMLLECWLACKDHDKSSDSLLHNKLLIGLANFFLRGYLKFHA